MDKQTTGNSRNHINSRRNDFAGIICHLKDKDFKWLKHDMGLFDLPESLDPEFGNDNEKPS